ncbi:hypothetical protein HYR99_05580 [Candidatus Poribacteria bacterium]|nr:hypothetical protein [Candidatus Poribacteria bacterium]
MIEVQLPIRKYQTTAGVAAVIGFLFGLLIPTVAFMTGHGSCPFGSGVIRVGGFVLLTGILSAALIGNGVALLLIFVAKFRQSSSGSRRRRK